MYNSVSQKQIEPCYKILQKLTTVTLIMDNCGNFTVNLHVHGDTGQITKGNLQKTIHTSGHL
jgi:hypothetical protein